MRSLSAITASVLIAIGIGIAALAAFGRSSTQPPSDGDATVSITAPTTHRGPTGDCLLDAPTMVDPGTGRIAVPPSATAVNAVWLPGMNATTCVARVTHGTAALARTLAAEIDHAHPIPRGVFACPLDDGSAVLLVFFSRSSKRASTTVSVSLSGCRGIERSGDATLVTPLALDASLARIAPNGWVSYLIPSR